jgi:hypothetical protein
VALADFYIIGAPKAGTTALHVALSRHPELYLSAVKEPKFFLCDGRPTGQRGPGDAHSAQEWIWRRRDYERLFDPAPPGTLKGESTPFYLWDTAAHDRIRAATPAAKLIAIVRDPIDRAYSNWTHLWCDGLEPESSFLAACDAEERRVLQGWAPFWRYQGLGRYGEQLQHLFGVFPREQVHVLKYRELVGEPQAALDTICRFLGVAEGRVAAVPNSNVSTWVPPTPVNRVLQGAVRLGARVGSHAPPTVWRRASAPLLSVLHRSGQHRPDLDPGLRRTLIERFTPDVELLGEIMGKSYADWLSPVGRGTYSTRSS